MASELSKFIEDELAEKGVTVDDSERLLGALRVEVGGSVGLLSMPEQVCKVGI